MTMRSQLISSARPFLLAVGAALLLAGCGASKRTDPPGAGARSSRRDLSAEAYRFAACMRSHGLPNFPYAQVVSRGPNGRVLRIHPPPLITTFTPRFRRAQAVCGGIIPGARFLSASDQAKAQAARVSRLLSFARCVRSHGLSRFPDPNAQGQLTAQMIDAAGIDVRSSVALRAARACSGAKGGSITLIRPGHAGP